MAKVSVIIPVYNAEEFLAQCLDSVCNQTLQDVEIICVNDGSKDNSLQLLQQYARNYPNLVVLDQENSGQSVARNAALAVAQGEYAFFLDSDDYIDVEALETLYKRAAADDLDILFYNAQSFFEDDATLESHRHYQNYYDRKSDYPGVYTGQELFVAMRENRDYFGSACLQMIRMNLLREGKISYYPGIIHEDNLFVFQCAMLAKRAGYIDYALYHRRVHDDSTVTKKKTIRNVEGYIVCYSEMLAFLRDIEMSDEVAEAVNLFLYYSMMTNIKNIYKSLDPEEREKQIAHGGPGIRHLLFVADRLNRTENERDSLKKRNADLQKKIGQLNEQLRRARPWIVRKVSGLIWTIRHKGLRYTWNLFTRKVENKLSRWDLRMNRFAAYRIATYIPRGILHFVRRMRRFGFKAACRMLGLRQYIKAEHKEPLVSFILPVYNAAEFLEQALDSLVRQTMKAIEIICVDDGSTDNSVEILHRYAAQDKRVRVFTQKNQYAGAARNLGMANAKGEYVVFLDSDDFFSEALAEKAYYQGKPFEADVVLFSAKHYHQNTGVMEDAPWHLNVNLLPKKPVFSHKDCPQDLYQITKPCPWTKMYRRQFLLDTKLQYQKIRNTNDLYFTLAAIAMAEKITAVNEMLVYYRVDQTTNLQATKAKSPFCFYDAFQGLKNTLTDSGLMGILHQAYVNTALNTSLWTLQTMRGFDAKRTVYDRLKGEILKELDLIGHSEEYYFNPAEYAQLSLILENDFDSFVRYYQELAQENIAQSKPLSAMERQILLDQHRQELTEFEESGNPLLSVLIPVYNVAPYLAECLDSILGPGMQNMEVVCVDDGSTDESGAILDEYARKDSRVKVFHKEQNAGLLMARKTGVELAKGRYIMFVDSDDYLDESAFDFIEKTIWNEYVDIVQFQIGVKDYSPTPQKLDWLIKLLTPPATELSASRIMESAYITRRNTTSLLGKIYKSEICKEAYSHIPETHCYIGEDLFTYFYLSHFASTYKGVRTPDYYVYRYGTGVSNQETMALKKFEAYCMMADYAKWIQHDSVFDVTDPTFIASFEALVRRMAEDCTKIYKNRIQEEDKPAAYEILVSYWGDFAAANDVARKMLGQSLK